MNTACKSALSVRKPHQGSKAKSPGSHLCLGDFGPGIVSGSDGCWYDPASWVLVFVYDGDGNRVKKTEGGETVLYVNQYYEVNTTTDVETSHYFLGGERVAYKKGSTLEYVHTDHLGSTSVTTNSIGTEVSTVKYFPFGGTRSTTGTLETDKLFTGQRLDQTGLYFYNARYYDATIGRFISPDTIVPDPYNPQSWNRYSYCYNNPLRIVDPTGHWPKIKFKIPGTDIKVEVDPIGDTVDGVKAIGSGAVNVGEFVGEKTVDGAQWVGDKVTDGTEAVVGATETALGIGNIDLITVDNYFGIPFPIPVITAQDSGLNLVNNTLDALGDREAAAPGVIIAREVITQRTLAHEQQHIKEQLTIGPIWFLGYFGEWGAKTAWYGASHSEDVYESLSFEERARDAAGQPDPPNDLPDEPWFWPW